jgi:hypothetical protein
MNISTLKDKVTYRVLVEREHWENLGVDGRIILKSLIRQWGWEAWTGLLWLRRVQVEGAGMELTFKNHASYI